MKQLTLLAAVSLILFSASPTTAGGWGVGGFGGISIPIEQDDAENGTVFGLKGRWSPIWSLTVEPQVFLLKNGDYDIVVDEDADPVLSETLKSWKVTSFGANLVLGAPAGQFKGVHPFFFGGLRLGAVDFDAPDRDAETKFGFGVGVGVEIGFGQVGLEIRGTGEALIGDSSSRKNGTITAGLNLYLGLPGNNDKSQGESR